MMWSWICEMTDKYFTWGQEHPVLMVLLFIAGICFMILHVKSEIRRYKATEYDGEEWYESYVETMTRLGLYNPDNIEDESKC